MSGLTQDQFEQALQAAVAAQTQQLQQQVDWHPEILSRSKLQASQQRCPRSKRELLNKTAIKR